jgi:amidase
MVPSLEAIGLLTIKGTTLQGFFDLNVRRAAAAKQYLNLFRDNNIDAILMPPGPHTAVPLDTWTTATYTALWNYLDYPAVVIPVDKVQESDAADDVSNAKYGVEDARVYSLCMHNSIPIFVWMIVADTLTFRHRPRALQRCPNLCSSGWI